MLRATQVTSRRLRATLPCRHLSSAAVDATPPRVWQPRHPTPWHASLIVDPHVDFFDHPVARVHREAAEKALRHGDSNGVATAATDFLSACSELPYDDPLWVAGCPFISANSPMHAPLRSCWSMVHSQASLAAGLTTAQRSRSGMVVGDTGVGKSQLLKLCTIVPSILLNNVVSVYFDATSGNATAHGLTPWVLLREALRRRLVRSATPLPRPDVIKEALERGCSISVLLSAAHVNQLAVVVCVDEAEATYHTDSPTANTWGELYDLLKSWTACTFVAGSTTMLPALVDGKDRDLIQSEMGFPQVRPSLGGDHMSVISVDPLNAEEQYREFLKGRCEDPEAVDLKQLHLSTSGRYRSIKRYLANPHSVSVDDNLEHPVPGDLAYALLGRMTTLLRMENHPGITDPFQERWVPEWHLMRWVQAYNMHHGTQFGYAAVMRLVDCGILRHRVGGPATEGVEYTFGSPRQLRFLLGIIPSAFISFAWTDSMYTIQPMLEQLHPVNAIATFVCTSPAREDLVSTAGVRPLEHTDAMSTLDEANAFMVLVLTEKYLERFQVDGSGVQHEVNLAVQLIQNGQGSKVLLASPDPAFASRYILPELPEELQGLAADGIFDTADTCGLAARMTSVASNHW